MSQVSYKCWFCEQAIEPKHFRSHLRAEKLKYEQLIQRADDFLNYNLEEDNKDPLQGVLDENDFTVSHNENNLAHNFIKCFIKRVAETVLEQGSHDSVEFVVADGPPISDNNPNNVISDVDTEPFELVEVSKDENVIEIGLDGSNDGSGEISEDMHDDAIENGTEPVVFVGDNNVSVSDNNQGRD